MADKKNINSNLSEDLVMKHFDFNTDNFIKLVKDFISREKINQNKKEKIRIKIIKFYKFVCLIIYLIMYNFSNSIDYQLFHYKFENITLRIKGRGNLNILGLSSYEIFSFSNKSYPDEIYINKIRQEEIKPSYYFNKTVNIV